MLLEVSLLSWRPSGAQSSKADIGPFGEPRVGVNQKGSGEEKDRGKCQWRGLSGDPSAHGSKLGTFAVGRRVGGERERCDGLA